MGFMDHLDAFDRLRQFVIDTRKAARLTQRDVAKRGQLPLGTIGNIEAGSRSSIPRQETLKGLAKGLGVPYEVLDRIVRGVPEATTEDNVLASLTLDLKPETKALLMSWLTMPENQRVAVEAGLTALIAALSQKSPEP